MAVCLKAVFVSLLFALNLRNNHCVTLTWRYAAELMPTETSEKYKEKAARSGKRLSIFGDSAQTTLV